MKKIFYITNTSYTLFSLRMNLMKSMEGDGYDVYAGAPRDQYSNLIMNNRISFYNIPMSQTGMNIFEEIRTILYLLKAFIKIRPDIIHLYSVKSIVWGVLSAFFFPSSKVVCTFTGMGILRSGGGLLRKVLFGIIRLTHRQNIYIFQNQPDLDFFQKHTNISGCTYLISGSGVDTEFFKRVNDVRRNRTFLMFSRMLYSKGVLEYLNAVKKLDNYLSDQADFLLLGGAYPLNPNQVDDEWLAGSDSIDPNLLLSKCSEANVKWIEHSNNVLKYLNMSDVVILPSYYPEGLPRSLLEAMSCENAIITTKMPGCEDVVDGSNGFLVDPRNVEQLKKYIEKFILMSDTSLHEMKQSSRNLVKQKFSDDVVISKYKEIYKRIYL